MNIGLIVNSEHAHIVCSANCNVPGSIPATTGLSRDCQDASFCREAISEYLKLMVNIERAR